MGLTLPLVAIAGHRTTPTSSCITRWLTVWCVMAVTLEELLDRNDLILAEAAIAERLRRHDGVTLHPTLFNSPFIYEEEAGKLMGDLYRQYVEIARSAGVPILLAAPTWRLDRERIREAGVPETINRDAVDYMLQVRSE